MFKPSVIKHWTIPSIFVFAALTLVVTLTGAHLAQAGGFNVDSLVTFTPLSSTYRTTTNTTGCPAGFVGKFTFTAQLTNKPDSPAMPGLDVLVQTLTNGNVLLDPQTNARLGRRGRCHGSTRGGAVCRRPAECGRDGGRAVCCLLEDTPVVSVFRRCVRCRDRAGECQSVGNEQWQWRSTSRSQRGWPLRGVPQRCERLGDERQ